MPEPDDLKRFVAEHIFDTPLSRIAKAAKKRYYTIRAIAIELGVLPKRGKRPSKELMARDDAIAQLYQKLRSLSAVAKAYNLSKERVRQIVLRKAAKTAEATISGSQIASSLCLPTPSPTECPPPAAQEATLSSLTR